MSTAPLPCASNDYSSFSPRCQRSGQDQPIDPDLRRTPACTRAARCDTTSVDASTAADELLHQDGVARRHLHHQRREDIMLRSSVAGDVGLDARACSRPFVEVRLEESLLNGFHRLVERSLRSVARPQFHRASDRRDLMESAELMEEALRLAEDAPRRRGLPQHVIELGAVETAFRRNPRLRVAKEAIGFSR